MIRQHLLLAAALAAAACCATAQTAPSKPYRQCPAKFASPSCGVLIVINANGTASLYVDSSVPPYDTSATNPIGMSEDTLVGIQNNSGSPISHITLSGNDIFGFDYSPGGTDPPLCNYGVGNCVYGYEGPGVSFTNISSSQSTGTVNFSPAIAPGGSAWFGLEGLPSTTIAVPPTTNCPTATATAGSPYSSQLTGLGGNGVYTWKLASGALPSPLQLSTQGLVSGTPASAGTSNFTLQITDGTGASGQQACSIAVSPAALSLSSISPTSAQAGGAQFNLTLTGGGFANGATVRWTPSSGSATTLTPASVSSTQIAVAVPANLIANAGTAAVAVTSGAVTTGSVTFTISAAPAPNFTLAIPAPPSSPTDQPALSIQTNSPAPDTYTGTVQLTFTPAANVANWPANTSNAQVVFVSTGTGTANFTIAKGATTGTFSASAGGAFQQGTVAGTITATITKLTSSSGAAVTINAPPFHVTVGGLAPVITPGSVHITNVTSSGFDVELNAYSTTRDLSGATCSFQPASGANLSGTSQSVTFGTAASSWFAGSGLANGGSFHLLIPFTYSGSAGALGPVTVSLTNTQGGSAPQTGQ